MKKLITSVLVIVAVLLLVAALFTFTSEKKASEDTPKTDIFKTSFVNGCLDGFGDMEGKEAICDCAYGKLINHYGEKGVLELALEYEGEELPDEVLFEMLLVTMECL